MKVRFLRWFCLLLLIALPVRGQVVINEVMYHPPPDVPEDPNLEWVELYNAGVAAQNLQGWKLAGGVDYVFTNVTLPAGGFLVVAANRAVFLSQFPSVTNVVGNWLGKLGNNVQTLRIEDAQGLTVNEVKYATEGDWARRVRGPNMVSHYGWEWEALHDGGGRSLELVNPNMANEHGQNWSASATANGTPGRANSVFAANTAPLILDVIHTPAVPVSSDTVAVTARILDELPAGFNVQLFFRDHTRTNVYGTNPPPTFTSVPMADDGLHNDGVAGDRIFGALIPQQTDKTVIEFYVQASDDGGRIRTWPAPARETNGVTGQFANALYQVDDTVYSGDQPFYRLIMTGTENHELNGQIGMNREPSGSNQSDAAMNTTFISVDGTGTRIRYLSSTRIRGAGSRGRRPINLRLGIPQDNPWNGYTEFNLNTQFTHAQLIGSMLAQKSGLATANARAVQVRLNTVNYAASGSPQFGSYACLEPIGAEWAQNHFSTDGNGNVYRGSRYPWTANLSYRGTNYQTYINNGYSKNSNRSQNDWSDLINLTAALSSTAPDDEYANLISEVLNVEEWLRYFAVCNAMDYRETSLCRGVGDDYAMYRGAVDTRFLLIAHDFDTILGQGDTSGSTTRSIWEMLLNPPSSDTNQQAVVLLRLMRYPDFAPLYYRELKRLIDTTFSSAEFDPMVDRVLGGFVPPDVILSMKNFVAGRNAYIRTQVPTNLTVNHSLPLQYGYPRTTTPAVALSGFSHAIDTRSVHLSGVPVTWTAWQASWSGSVSLQPGINRLLVQAFNASGLEIARTNIDIWFDDSSVTAVSGTVSADTTWTAANGPYQVTGSILVPAGVTLTVEPGTAVYFAAGAGLNVNGRLLAQGVETRRIRFTREPGASSPSNSWAGLAFSGSLQSNRLSYVDIDYAGSAGHSLLVDNSILIADSLSFAGTSRTLCELANASVHIRNSSFPTIAGAEHIHGGPVPAGGFVVIEGNTFGTTTLLNDIIDFTGARWPDAVLQILNNTFTAASDDVLDLDGADALVEGNIFMRVHKLNPNPGDTSSAISYGADSGYSPNIVAVRNLFYDVDHVALCKEGGTLSLVNNTAVGIGIAAVNFSEPERNTLPGAGAYLDGNIFWNPPGWTGTNFQNLFPTNGTVDLTVNRSIFWATDGLANGVGNLIADPRLANADSTNISHLTIRNDFRLLAGSPAIGAGPNGLDMGGLVPAGASISGEPLSPTPSTAATLTVGGPGISHYRYRLNGGSFGAESPVANPIVLTGLANGSYTVRVVGKNYAGVWQDVSRPTESRTWVVNAALSRVVVNEVLARNDDVGYYDGRDLVELYNAGGTSVDLGGWGVTDDATSQFKFRFPAGTALAPGQYLVLLSENSGGASGHYLGFGLNDSGDAVYLYDSAGVLVDSVVFGFQISGQSIGRIAPNGEWGLASPTFGQLNVAQPVGEPRNLMINEWLADGQALYPDDFIELYNPDPSPVNVGGFYLTDTPQGSPDRSRIPPLSFIKGGSFFVFIADGRPELGAQHVNFKLGAEQGWIGLFAPNLSLVDSIFYGPQTTDVSEGRQPGVPGAIAFFKQPTPGGGNPGATTQCSVQYTTLNLMLMTNAWKYFQPPSSLGTAWRNANYDDSSWPSGRALLYAEGAALPAPKNTPLTLGNMTYYFRTSFVLNTNPAGFILNLSTVLDDGAVIYLNGVELTRIRMPGGTITYSTTASQSVGDATTEFFTATPSSLLQGTNVLAVEVHQSDAGSSDVVWGLALSATRAVTNCAARSVVLNEVMANNQSTRLADGAVSDWVELHNPSTNSLDLSGMSLSDRGDVPDRWIFPVGVTLPAGGYLVVRFDGTNAPSTNADPVMNTGFGLNAETDQVILFSRPGPVRTNLDALSFGLQIPDFSVGRLPSDSEVWELNLPTPGGRNIPANLGDPAVLLINEWMPNPDGGDDWFEIYNPGAQPVRLGGLFLTDNLAPGSREQYQIPDLSYLGSGPDAYVRFWADRTPSRGADHTSFRLDNSAESIGLYFSETREIDHISYPSTQRGVSEGRFPDGATNFVRFPGTDTPGSSNLRALNEVVINEVLTHTDAPLEDAIELHNPTGASVDVSGWYLTDTRSDPYRYRIPEGTVIEPGGYVVFYEFQFNPFDGLPPSFALNSAEGDNVYLYTADESGALTGYRAGVKFGAALNGVSFGRYDTIMGTDFTALSNRTFGVDTPAALAEFRQGRGAPNAYPLVGPVVISEIHYHPPDIVSGGQTNDNSIDEFIELYNLSGTNVPLHDPLHATNGWRLRDAVDFDFPSGAALPPGAFALVVNFDPLTNFVQLESFRSRFSVPPGTPIFGPYGGKLANDNDNIELYRPDAPLPPEDADAGYVPYVLADKVRYTDTLPWPFAPDGTGTGVGYSLQRRTASDYGNDPVNWVAGTPTAGAATGPALVEPPTVTSITPPHSADPGATDTLTATASGAGPLSYQWLHEGTVVLWGSGPTLVITNVQAANAGTYTLLVFNAGGSAAASTQVGLRQAPVIARQPADRVVPPGGTGVFTVSVRGSTPLAYQWWHDGVLLEGANGPSLAVTNVQPASEGGYLVVVTNLYGAVTSRVAYLSINAAPFIVTQPQSTNVFVGTTVEFSVRATGSQPLRYQWRFGNDPIPGATNASLLLPNVQLPQAGNYSVLLSNSVGTLLSAPATLTVTIPPYVSVTALVPVASEPATHGRFRLTRTGPTSIPVTVNFSIEGSATPNQDYVALVSPVTIPAGSASLDLPVVVLDDPILEGDETVVLVLANGADYAPAPPVSATVRIVDNDNKSPTIVIVNPVDGLMFSAPASVPIGVLASDVDGVVALVEFFANGTNKLGEARVAPFDFVWTNAPAGSHVLTAVARDERGATAFSQPVEILINALPAVRLTSPVNNSAYPSNAAITLTATASDPDGAVRRVEFFEGANLLGVAFQAPFTMVWNSAPAGNYTLTARATDDRGEAAVSAPVSISVDRPVAAFADRFADRSLLIGFTNVVTGWNTNYTKEPGEPRHLNRNGSHSAWVSWLAPASGACTVDTIGSSSDTVLAIYLNNPPSVQTVSNLVLVASADDGGGGFTSRTNFTATANVTYQIAVDGYANADAGNIVLHVAMANSTPTIVTQPRSQTVNQGTTVTLDVAAGGPGTLSYQWRFNGAMVPGGNRNSLTVNNVQPENEGLYTVSVSNSSGSVTSAPAVLTVRRMPALLLQPQTQVVDPGQDAIFRASAGGSSPLAYQWLVDGVAVGGATNTTFTWTDAGHADRGNISLVVANAAGSTASQSAELIVRPVVASVTLAANQTLVLTIRATPGRQYNIERSADLSNWSSIGVVTPAAVEIQFADPTPLGVAPRFYRLHGSP